MSTKNPAFQFYPGDFLTGTVATYDLPTIGAYMVLLSYEWSMKGLPNDRETLAKLLRIHGNTFNKIWSKLADQFVERDGKLYNPRLDKEREKQELWRAKSSAGGKASAEKRWGEGKGGDKGGLRLVKKCLPPNDNISSSSSVTTRSKSPRREGAETPKDNWVARGVEIWTRSVGPIPHPRFGKALGPLVEKHGSEPVMAGLERYIATTKAAGKTLRVEWFANEGEVWIERAKQPLIVDGWMSDELERATRPNNRSA